MLILAAMKHEDSGSIAEVVVLEKIGEILPNSFFLIRNSYVQKVCVKLILNTLKLFIGWNMVW